MFVTAFDKYKLISDKIQKNNVGQILTIGLLIKKFYIENIADKNIEKFIISKDIIINLSKPYYIKLNTSNPIPTYIKTGNKLLDDYIYLDNLIKFILSCNDIIISNTPIKIETDVKLDPASIAYSFYYTFFTEKWDSQELSNITLKQQMAKK